MVKLTQSLSQWLFDNHREKMVLIMFGHVELMTDEMWKEYIAWCKTEEGEQYLRGGSKCKPDPETDGIVDEMEDDNGQ